MKKVKPIGVTFGKATPSNSQAIIEGDVGLFDFVKIGKNLCQIDNIWIESDLDIEDARDILNGATRPPIHDVLADVVPLDRLTHPIMPGSLINPAKPKDISNHLFGDSQRDIVLGSILRMGKVEVFLDLNVIHNHIAIVGMTGKGKSNTGKVILSQMAGKVPVVIVDPHGEHDGFQVVVDEVPENTEGLDKITIVEMVQTFIPKTLTPILERVIQLADRFHENSIKGLYETIKSEEHRRADRLLPYVEQAIKIEHATQNITKILEKMTGTTPVVINLRGVDKESSEFLVKVVADKILKLGKAGKGIHLAIDEAHEFCPQGETTISKKSIINLAFGGRKFGCGLIVMSLRPAKLDKNVLSQCNTKIILKLTNENDIKQTRASTESSTKQMFDEVQRLKTGEALLVSPMIERPVFVRIDEYKEE